MREAIHRLTQEYKREIIKQAQVNVPAFNPSYSPTLPQRQAAIPTGPQDRRAFLGLRDMYMNPHHTANKYIHADDESHNNYLEMMRTYAGQAIDVMQGAGLGFGGTDEEYNARVTDAMRNMQQNQDYSNMNSGARGLMEATRIMGQMEALQSKYDAHNMDVYRAYNTAGANGQHVTTPRAQSNTINRPEANFITPSIAPRTTPPPPTPSPQPRTPPTSKPPAPTPSAAGNAHITRQPYGSGYTSTNKYKPKYDSYVA